MLEIFNKWYRRYLFEEESVLLLVLLTLAVAVLMTIGDILAPVLAALILAYLMQGLASGMQRLGLPQWLGVSVAFIVFIGAFFGFIFGLLPLAWRQLLTLAGEMPRMLEQGRHLLIVLPERYPDFVSQQQINHVLSLAQSELAGLGQTLVTKSLTTIPSIVSLLVYIILIPILVFFFLKDRQQLISWCSTFLPSERPLLRRIWGEMNTQVANYARGKVLEIIIVGATSYACFAWMGLNYAALLALLVGLSVIIPYIGAAIVTVPVLAVAYLQWGLASEFYYLMLVYFIIQGLDGNVLVPLLFSEAVNLHPVAIILAVLFFGGIWGLWGVFFAIPLATLIKAIINAWPTPADETVLVEPEKIEQVTE
ncbi:AI-2E family transporter [Parahaliea sp. F7430]|uniref:AI-2E family transporter n=1 Tax=Sediminihaliea albiluteola TaxID=2758564 RepID=A0A7W2TYF8_9GAMM|nr:AI-2E family transporter [Sediminihaliea albiluteola]MBA6414241.1 AI-2E family transporter [Sediminihaliea albiluteola]